MSGQGRAVEGIQRLEGRLELPWHKGRSGGMSLALLALYLCLDPLTLGPEGCREKEGKEEIEERGRVRREKASRLNMKEIQEGRKSCVFLFLCL
jgi:hypothetical protein